MMGSGQQDGGCDTGLSLGSLLSSINKKERSPSAATLSVSHLKFDHVLPSLSLGAPADHQISASPGSSSYSNNAAASASASTLKRSPDRDKDEFGGCHGVGEEVEMDKDAYVSQRIDDYVYEEEEASPCRKKLRLTKDQSAVLEDSFKDHSTLNPNQKQALARQLNLRPRQVEVWFQNRRARTKLKQTEMDCELLKKSCKALTEENKRLQKEVQELKALKMAAPGYMAPMPIPTTLSMCPSCGRLIKAASPVSDDHRYASSAAGTTPFYTMNGTKPPQLFTHSSAAC